MMEPTRAAAPRADAGVLRAGRWLAGASALILGLTGLAIGLELDHGRSVAAAQLEAISGLRATQISRWLRERMNTAGFLMSSGPMADSYWRWQGSGDPAALAQMLERVVTIRQSTGYQGALILDASGQAVAAEAPADAATPPELRAAALEAMASGRPQRTELYGDPGPAPSPRLDVVFPLNVTGKPARAALAFRVDPHEFLFPSLGEWPVPSRSGRSLLVRKVGGKVVVGLGQSEVEVRVGALSTRVLNGTAPARAVLDGIDFEGTPVLGVVTPIDASGWYLVTKVDQAEVRAAALDDLALIACLGALLLAASAIAIFRVRDRQALRAALAAGALQAAELRSLYLLDSIANESSDVIFAKDRQGRFLLFNPAAERTFGLDSGQMLGRRAQEVLAPQAGETIGAIDERVMGEDRTLTAEEVLETPSGPRTFFITRGPLHDAAGAVIGLFGISRDITERIELERRLREREAALQRSQIVARLGHAVIGPGGAVESVSQALPTLLGRPSTGMPRNIREFLGWVHADDRDALREQIRGLSASSARVDFRYRLQRGDGSWIHVLHSTVPLDSEGGGEGVRWFVTLLDVTAQTEAQIELERHRHHLEELVAERAGELREANVAAVQAQAFLLALTDNLPGRIAYWNRDLTCGFVNRVYCEWFGRRREELIGRTMTEVFGADRLQARNASIAAVLAGQPQNFEIDVRRADGQWAHEWVHFIPDLHEDEVRGFFVLATDVSDLKKAELRLQLSNRELTDARNRAEAATVAKSAFLANMSHEIRTPMNAIIGLTHLLKRDLREPAQRDRLGKVGDAAQHLLTIINDILDLSKIESGKLQLDPTEFALEPMLTRVCALVADGARAKGLELVVDTRGVPAVLHGDSTRLSQAILNLLSNAVKFTAAGSVSLRCEALERRPDSLLVRFAVRDTGIGIAPDKIGALFADFEQGDSSMTRRFGGTGLGLSITRQLAALMGGAAGVDSEPGVGSTFWFTARLGQARSQPPPVREVRLSGARALLADDLPQAREALAEMLRQLGLRVDAAESGEAALLLADAADAAGDPYSVAVLDWRMPGLDGVATCRRLKASGRRAQLHCVIVTAHDEPLLWSAARGAGIGSVLVKPVSASTLHEALTGLLGAGAPRAKRLAPTGDAFAAVAAAHRGARVLLAEDNPINQEVALELLRSAGLHVEVARDGAEAVRMAQSSAYDLILMDVQMPELDGLQATRILRALPHFGAVPIIAMTANAFGEDRRICLDAGMVDHVAKPVDPDHLYATLLRWLPERSGGAAVPSPVAVATKPASPPPAPLGEQLGEIAGFNFARGLAVFDGRLDLYVRVLRSFAGLYASGMPELARALASGSCAGLGAAGHSLRGASGSIGAAGLLPLLSRIEAGVADVTQDADRLAAAAQLQALLIETAQRIETILEAEPELAATA